MAKKSLMPSDDELRAEFHRLCAERDRIEAESSPHREAYNAKRAEFMQMEKLELDPLVAQMKLSEDGLHDIKQDIAAISRTLKGKVGDPPMADRTTAR